MRRLQLPEFFRRRQAVAETTALNTTPAKPQRNYKKIIINILSVLLIVTTIVGVLGFFLVFIPARNLYRQAQMVKIEAQKLNSTISTKDIGLIEGQLGQLEKDFINFKNSYNAYKLPSMLPYVNSYYKDGQKALIAGEEGISAAKIVLAAVKPYTDFLGLKGEATDAGKTTEDRINFLTQSVEGLLPHLDGLEQKVKVIDENINAIDPSRYPEEFRGYPIRQYLLKAQEAIATGHTLVRDGKPILTHTSWLLGKDAPRNYLLIFQNDAELRPSGGFWTAYGTITVDKGKIIPGVSQDIYSLDAKLNSTIPAPRPIKAYHINVPYLNLRDMNLSPDFPTDAKIFLDYYQKLTKTQNIDAVIALDTNVLVDLVAVLGRIGVPEWGNFSAEPDKRCDGCPQIIYQLEWIAGRPRDYIETNRKGFLGPLMHSILSNAMGSEKSKISPLVQAGLKNINQKHLMFYFRDPAIQEAAAKANIAGSINNNLSPNTDYFHLNDANMASAKSNIFIKQKIKHEIIAQNGKVEHKVSVTYTNPSRASNCNLEKGDLCLNAPKYRNWFRFYVPKGSKLSGKMTGTEVETVEYEEFDKQVFEGFYGDKYPLYAQSNLKTSIQYVSSVKPSPQYSLLLQKQPGTKPVEYELYVNGKLKEKFNWEADRTIKLSL